MAIQWTQNLAVGVREIDNQHKELFRRIDDMIVAMSQGKGEDIISNTIRFLQEYVVTHFSEEENLMTRHHYPGLQIQKMEHAKFIHDLQKLKQDFEEKGAALSLLVQVQQRTASWLANHISKLDKQIGVFLNEKQQQEAGARLASGM